MTTRGYRKYDEDFKQGAVAMVVETGKPIARVARELAINESTLGNWCGNEGLFAEVLCEYVDVGDVAVLGTAEEGEQLFGGPVDEV
jgi:hypothetical protein